MIVKKLIKPISKVGVANVDLDNYYTKSQIDSKITTIDSEKQDTLTAGNNITISNNVISANVPQVDLSNYYTKIEVDDKLQDYLAITTFNQTIQQIQTKQAEQDTLIAQKANISDLNGYAKLNKTNNGQFFIGDKNGKHIWFAQPFQYSGNTYSSIKIRNGGTNYFTMEHNFNTNQSIISNPRGGIQLKNIATPTENSDGVNKQYVDTKIANIPSPDLTNYYTRSEVDAKIDWEVVDANSITRDAHKTTIPLNGKRFVHLQGTFTPFVNNTGSWSNFTPFTLDTQNYNYQVRFPIFDWNTQRINGSIQVDLDNGNLVLTGYNTSNQEANYYLWGDVLVK